MKGLALLGAALGARPAPPELPEAIAPFAADLVDLEGFLRNRSGIGFDLLAGLLEAVFGAGGKRIRPALVFAVGRLAGTMGPGAEARRAAYPPDAILRLAAAIETLHTATLVHDDLVDGAATRRGRPTLHGQWGAGATILAGDWLFARASAFSAGTGAVRVVQLFAQTLEALTDGELRQLFGRRGRPTTDEYELRIYGKTASLFETATESAAVLIGAEPEQVAALSRFGRSLGMGFQIIDDILDFTADEETLGKPVGSDLRSGQITLPALLYLERHPASDLWARGQADGAAVEDLIAAVRADEAAIAGSRAAAQAHLNTALACLQGFTPGPALDLLAAIARYAVDRDR